jgi:hypothetical protein
MEERSKQVDKQDVLRLRPFDGLQGWARPDGAIQESAPVLVVNSEVQAPAMSEALSGRH